MVSDGEQTPARGGTSAAVFDRGRPWTQEDLRRAYAQHGAAVYALAQSVCGRRVADEVTSRVFLELWQHPEKFDPAQGSLRMFLVVAALRVSNDMIRAERADRMREALVGSQPDASRSEADDRRGPTVQGEPIAQALGGLSDDEREAVATTLYSGATYPEVAVALRLPQDKLKASLRLGLQNLSVAYSQQATVVERAMSKNT